ncbi:2-hydroxyacyl-CoA dehydratase family protein [Gordonia sp. NB41Y]|uniref:2-hydroxyacyl-CoA dehydratase subunit D n=1 Tax=Gordonia sp. NB41Y TaxID=875808 RepID=UPI0006B17C37|nr:2-hydroxyacyl-CoA dehydratase family protein [Gordonia sp. NB41Y]EMP11840.2 benzoyl-CoA reductase [Gordonia sp. NB41Y]WLP89048.1 2-hydroxyacyl-CoA dehydratase family protein [Gordonia sp. NB41Y]
MSQLHAPSMALLKSAADDPAAYVQRWKSAHGRPAIGTFPMNFPVELVHAANAHPVIIQESRTPITEGRSLLAEFYCGYTRSVADQIAIGELDGIDAFVAADHCVQLLGAVDVIRYKRPDTPVHFAQFTSAMDGALTRPRVENRISELTAEIEKVTGTAVTPERITASIRAYNGNRQLLREFYALRKSGRAHITASQMQLLVKSSMVMDIDEHTTILRTILADLRVEQDAPADVVRIHLSGHFCHAPRPEILDAIEDSGAIVVDDDLYTGYRYISTDVPETDDPLAALTTWYLDRNVNAPCPTRVTSDVDWDTYLLDSVAESGANGVVVLMAKFCEPHMLYYPELRKALDAHGIPLLLIETEHEGLPLEKLRTQLETFVERIRRRPAPIAV